MKGIYGIFNKTLFQINDNVHIEDMYDKAFYSDYNPNSVTNEIITNENNLRVKVSLSNILEKPYTNNEIINNVLTLIKANKVKTIDKLLDRYDLAIEYHLLSEDNQPVDSGINYVRINTSDMVIPLVINENNDLSYKIGKKFMGSFNLIYRSMTSPFGLHYSDSTKFTLIIDNIMILEHVYEVVDPVFDDRSMNGVSHPIPCPDDKTKYIIIYDSKAEGIKFDPIKINFKPRNIEIDVSLDLDNYFIVNDTDIITNELYNGSDDDETIPTIIVGDGSTFDSSSVSKDVLDPDNKGYYFMYCRVKRNDLFAKLVVSNNTLDGVYNENTMVKLEEIKKYITDIEEGEYVALKKYLI